MRNRPEYAAVTYRGWSPYVGRHGVFYELWHRSPYGGWCGIKGVPMKTCSSLEELTLYAAKAGISASEIIVLDRLF